jgi:hypothetical protein
MLVYFILVVQRRPTEFPEQLVSSSIQRVIDPTLPPPRNRKLVTFVLSLMGALPQFSTEDTE